MSKSFDVFFNFGAKAAALVACVCLVAMFSSTASAQFINGTQISQIGGVYIDSNGVVNVTSGQLSQKLRAQVLKELGKSQGELSDATEMRVVSLKGLHAEVAKAVEENKQIPEEVLFMAGMQRVKYVLLVPEKNDILLVGPGEGWTVDQRGNVVGKTTGLPVLHLEDLMIAMRSSDEARQGQGISVSINPTEEGTKKLTKFFRDFQRSGRKFDRNAASAVEQTMGPQDVSLTGVDTSSRFAQVLVAADYKMKRLSMGFENAPVKDMPSFLEMCQKSNTSLRTLSPRFWMECNYKPVKHSKDNLAWQIDGSVKALTENEIIEKSGKRVGTGKANKLAKKWAEGMTKNYDALAKAEPVFAELQNIMDLSVVAALIEKHGMLKKVGLAAPYLTTDEKLQTPSLHVPKTVPTQCSFASLTRSTLVTASGGVQLDSWGVLDSVEMDTKVADVRSTVIQAGSDRWWWNAE
jgi:hypothetical protein